MAGGAAARELAGRGLDVVLLERFQPGHRRGSSGGPTRIFRFSYPDPFYVRLAREALGDWERLASDAGRKLMEDTTGVYFGDVAMQCASAMEEAGERFETIHPAEAAERFGMMLDRPGFVDPYTKVIAAAATVEAQLSLAAERGAAVLYDSRALGIRPSPDGCRVDTESDSFTATWAVIAAGSWGAAMAVEAGITLDVTVTCEEVAYLSPAPGLPVVVDYSDPLRYLAPALFGAPGVKVGSHHTGIQVDPEDGPFDPSGSSREEIRWLERLVPEAGEFREVQRETCLYTNTPDEEFVILKKGPVVCVSACSGHGFKFAPLMGRAVADLVQGRDSGAAERFIRRL